MLGHLGEAPLILHSVHGLGHPQAILKYTLLNYFVPLDVLLHISWN